MTGAQILDATGRPAKARALGSKGRCPDCGSDKREASGAFGDVHPCCSQCGHEWTDETWQDQ